MAAQRFRDQMKDSADYLNETTRYGKSFLIGIVRLDSHDQKAYAAQVVQRPSARSAPDRTVSKATETDFLAAIANAPYREAMSGLFSAVTALGLQLVWYMKGAPIRLKTPDRNEPISIGWLFLEGGQWSGAEHVTFGVDPGTLKNHPTVATAITAVARSSRLYRVGSPPRASSMLSSSSRMFPGSKGRSIRPPRPAQDKLRRRACERNYLDVKQITLRYAGKHTGCGTALLRHRRNRRGLCRPRASAITGLRGQRGRQEREAFLLLDVPMAVRSKLAQNLQVGRAYADANAWIGR